MNPYHSTILLVEDEPEDQLLIVRAFRANGVDNPIQVVSDGDEAIAYLMGEGQFADRQKFAYPTFISDGLENAANGWFCGAGAFKEKSSVDGNTDGGVLEFQ